MNQKEIEIDIIVAELRLYNRFCQSIGLPGSLLVCLSINRSIMIESKSVEISNVTLPEYMGVEGGVKRVYTPLPTHPQRYCKATLFVLFKIPVSKLIH